LFFSKGNSLSLTTPLLYPYFTLVKKVACIQMNIYMANAATAAAAATIDAEAAVLTKAAGESKPSEPSARATH
jgi:hypothetical protein